MDNLSSNGLNNPTNNINNNQSRKPLIIASVIIAFLVIILAVMIFFLNRAQGGGTAGSTSPSSILSTLFGSGRKPTGGVASNSVSVPPGQEGNETGNQTSKPNLNNLPSTPEVKVANWVLEAEKPASSLTQAQVYSFKTSYTDSDGVSLAKKFLGSNIGTEKGTKLIGYYPLNSGDKQASMFFFNTAVGTFSYASTEGVEVSGTDGKPESKATAFLKSVLPDSTVKLTASYKRKDQADYQYFEYHRDWKETGLPILNPLGLLDLPETQTMSKLSLTNAAGNLSKDDQVYATSDSSDGLPRQNDFNTVTVVIDVNHGNLIALNSNLRQLNQSQVKTVSLISFNEAVEKLKNNRYESLLTKPSGQGSADYNKVYPGNRSTAKTATVTEAVLAYLENSPSVVQSTLAPYYVFRGYTNLDSGYKVNFIATVPAQADSKLQVNGSLGSKLPLVLGESTTATPPAQQQSTINFPASCPKGGWGFGVLPIEKLKNVRQMGQIKAGDGYACYSGVCWWIFYIPEGQMDVNSVISTVRTSGVYGRDNAYFVRDYLTALENPDCAVRISGGSPSVFVYGRTGSVSSVSLSKIGLTYADPISSDNLWQVTSLNNGKLKTQSGSLYDYLYYEYLPTSVSFTKPVSGWTVNRSKVEELVRGKIAPALKLTEKETSRAIYEISHAAYYIEDQTLFVGVVSPGQVDTQLPLTVSDNLKHVYRYHFYVSAAGGKDKVLPEPVLHPIDRSQPFLLEIGGVRGE